MSAFSFGQRRLCRSRSSRWYRQWCSRQWLTRFGFGDDLLLPGGRRCCRCGRRQRLTCFGVGDELLLPRRGGSCRRSRCCRRRSRRRLTDDRRVAICRWRSGGLGLTGCLSVCRTRILNRYHLLSERRRNRGRQQSSSPDPSNAGSDNTGVGRR